MKIYYYIFLIVALYTTSCCIAWKQALSRSGDVNTAVNNVITDFIHTSKYFKADSVFEVIIIDKEDKYIIAISRAINKIYPRTSEIVDTYDELIPNKYIIHNDRLFYWNDPNEKISENIINTLLQYNQIDLNWRDVYYDISPYTFDDGVEGVVYYICKNNLTNYKKTGLNNLFHHYKEPKLKCK